LVSVSRVSEVLGYGLVVVISRISEVFGISVAIREVFGRFPGILGLLRGFGGIGGGLCFGSFRWFDGWFWRLRGQAALGSVGFGLVRRWVGGFSVGFGADFGADYASASPFALGTIAQEPEGGMGVLKGVGFEAR